MLVLADIVAGTASAAGGVQVAAPSASRDEAAADLLDGSALSSGGAEAGRTDGGGGGRRPRHPGAPPPPSEHARNASVEGAQLSPAPAAAPAPAPSSPSPVGVWVPSHRRLAEQRSPPGLASPPRQQQQQQMATVPEPLPPASPAAPPPVLPAAAALASPDGGGAVKVRWNACRAIAAVLPLAHRVVSTHATAEELASGGTRGGMSASRTSRGIAYQGSSTSLTASPPRPRVRKDAVSGTALALAGVDHVSTAHSPFAPKAPAAAPPPAVAAAAAARDASSALRTPAAPGGEGALGSEALSPARGGPSSPSPSTTPGQHSGARGGGVGGGGAFVVVTDPTRPSVHIGCTWVPPVLAAVQVRRRRRTSD